MRTILIILLLLSPCVFAATNPWHVLGLETSASKEMIQSRFRKLAKEFHPDKYSGRSVEEQRAAETRFREVKTAYDELMASVSRQTTGYPVTSIGPYPTRVNDSLFNHYDNPERLRFLIVQLEEELKTGRFNEAHTTLSILKEIGMDFRFYAIVAFLRTFPKGAFLSEMQFSFLTKYLDVKRRSDFSDLLRGYIETVSGKTEVRPGLISLISPESFELLEPLVMAALRIQDDEPSRREFFRVVDLILTDLLKRPDMFRANYFEKILNELPEIWGILTSMISSNFAKAPRDPDLDSMLAKLLDKQRKVPFQKIELIPLVWARGDAPWETGQVESILKHAEMIKASDLMHFLVYAETPGTVKFLRLFLKNRSQKEIQDLILEVEAAGWMYEETRAVLKSMNLRSGPSSSTATCEKALAGRQLEFDFGIGFGMDQRELPF